MSRELIEKARHTAKQFAASDKFHAVLHHEMADALEKALDRLEKAEAVCRVAWRVGQEYAEDCQPPRDWCRCGGTISRDGKVIRNGHDATCDMFNEVYEQWNRLTRSTNNCLQTKT